MRSPVQIQRDWMAGARRWLARLGMTGVALVSAPILLAFIWLRFFGLPANVKGYVLKELEARGLVVDFDRLLLDPSGGFIAERLTVYRGGAKEQVWVQVDRVRIGIAWFSWWRGQPFLESGSIRNATLQLPIGPEVAAVLDEVSADVRIGPKAIEIVGAKAKLLNFALDVKGRIRLTGMAPIRPTTPEATALRERAWKTFETYAGELQGERPIQVRLDFDLPTASPQEVEGMLVLNSHNVRWRGTQVEEFAVLARMENSRMLLEDVRFRLSRGELQIKGEWDVAERTGEFEFNSDLDFTPLASAIGGKAGLVIGNLGFRDLPRISGRLRLSAGADFRYNLQTDVDWLHFSYANVEFDHLILPLAFDGHRLLLTKGELVGKKGGIVCQALVDADAPLIKGKLVSTVDPTLFRGMLGDAADRFFDSLRFGEQAPKIEARINGDSMDWKALVANGKLTARDFSYKNIAVISAESEFIFSKGQLNLPTLAVTRTEGSGKGQVLYDFGERWVELKGVNAKIHVQEIAPMFGPRFTEYMQPYRFVQPPKVIANGKIDLNETRSPQLTDLAVQVESDGLLGYTFLGVPLQFKKPSVDLTIKNRQLHLKSKSAELFDGKVGLTLDLNMDKPVPEFSTSINLADCNFQSFMKSFFGYEQSTGNLTARGNFQGALGRMDTMKGEGNVTVVEGFVLNIPFLGGLSELLGSIIPNFGVAKAGKAFANYTLADGIVTTQDLEIASANFTMLGRGGYSYIKDDLNMDARVNVRGVVGLLLFPVSKLFEYHGSGSLKNPKWSPKIFEG